MRKIILLPFLLLMVGMSTAQHTIYPDLFIIGSDSLLEGSGVYPYTRFIFDIEKGGFSGGSMGIIPWHRDSIGSYSFSSGLYAMASGDNGATALGYSTKSIGDYGATSLGRSTTASGDWGATALGYETEASGDWGAIALGRSTTASGGYGATALGNSTIASGYYGATALGLSTIADGYYGATALGYKTEASEDYGATALGDETEASGDHGATALGHKTKASEDYGATALGHKTEAIGDYGATALGDETEASGDRGATALGSNSKANGHYSATAMGHYTIANANSGVVVGQYNDTIVSVGYNNIDKPVFIVGNGTNSILRSNALVVRQDGNIGINNNADVGQLSIKQKTSNDESGMRIISSSDSAAWVIRYTDNGGGNLRFRAFADDGTIDHTVEIRRSDGMYLQNSDRRLKKNIKYMDGILDRVLSIQPANYNWKKQSDHAQKSMGVIAQELEILFPSAVSTNEDGIKMVNYDALGILAIQAIKEQQEEIDELRSNYRKDIDELKTIVQSLITDKSTIDTE